MRAGVSTTDVDLYSGFEGEPEVFIELRRPDGSTATIHVWLAVFDAMMDFIEPGPDGWSGITLPHHMATGWDDGGWWVDPDPADTLSKLEGIAEACAADGESVRVLREAFAGYLREAIEGGGRVSIRQD